MKTLFITATGTNIGKTHTTLKLMKALAAQGLRVGVFKPIETGVQTTAPDATLLLHACQAFNPLFEAFSPLDITAYTFALPAAPFCADIHHTIDIEVILKKYHFLCKYCDILLIEGAGGLLVPITQDFTMLDLIVKLSTPTLLITPSRLGCINDTLLSIQALKSRNISFDWCVNLHEDQDSFSEVTQPYYDATFPQWWSVEKGLERYVENLCYDTSIKYTE